MLAHFALFLDRGDWIDRDRDRELGGIGIWMWQRQQQHSRRSTQSFNLFSLHWKTGEPGTWTGRLRDIEYGFRRQDNAPTTGLVSRLMLLLLLLLLRLHGDKNFTVRSHLLPVANK